MKTIVQKPLMIIISHINNHHFEEKPLTSHDIQNAIKVWCLKFASYHKIERKNNKGSFSSSSDPINQDTRRNVLV